MSLRIPRPDPAGQLVVMPAWAPGSYVIRNFSRHVVRMRAVSAGKAVALTKVDKDSWRASPCRGALEIHYEAYAADPSVAGSFVDTTGAFINGPSLLMRAAGSETAACVLELAPPAGRAFRTWHVATALGPRRIAKSGFGRYRARTYEDLIEHPLLIGPLSVARFPAGGIAHAVAICGPYAAEAERLARDLARLCAQQQRFFGGTAPFERYLFLLRPVAEGQEGLPHLASAAILCSRNDLADPSARNQGEGYFRLLRLCSREYFRAWLGKRLKPRAFVPLQLDREAYTGSLWMFEGFPSYFQGLALVRSGLIRPAAFLGTLAGFITTVMRTPGRFKQSVAEASFDTWIKFSRRDENAPNAAVNYESKGALIALALDLTIRLETGGRKSLDDVVRALWERHREHGNGVEAKEFETLVAEIAGRDLGRFFHDAVQGTADLPIGRLLARAGVGSRLRPAWSESDMGGLRPRRELAPARRCVLGVRTMPSGGGVLLSHVLDGGAAQAAGLAAGDLLAAIAGRRVTAGNFERLLARFHSGQTVRIHAFRRDEFLAFDVALKPPAADTCELWFMLKPPRAALLHRAAWLGRGVGAQADDAQTDGAQPVPA